MTDTYDIHKAAGIIIRNRRLLVERSKGKDVFTVNTSADIGSDNEVEEIRWITTDIPEDIEVGSIFAHDVLPRLKSMDLVD